ncbi:MAG: hypothetical protein QOF27_1512 [Gaiellaceae bacterium]|nr:hypothetical protein [Gaiellaceae bacterium]
MSNAKKLIASALAIASIAAVPSTSFILSGTSQGVHVACGSNSSGCV